MTRNKLAALNDDIRAGLPASELREKHLQEEGEGGGAAERVVNAASKLVWTLGDGRDQGLANELDTLTKMRETMMALSAYYAATTPKDGAG